MTTPVRCRPALLILVATAGLTGLGTGAASGFPYELVSVGDAGNAAGFYGYGAVDYDFRIGTHEVTIGHYATFLNAVAKSDPYSLYHARMAADGNSAGIARSGLDGDYSYGVIDNAGDSGDRPITYVSWFDAARFANWMANGQPTTLATPAAAAAVINDGAYTLHAAVGGVAPARNAVNPLTGSAPAFFLPNENEWYKAAYFNRDHGGPGVPGRSTPPSSTSWPRATRTRSTTRGWRPISTSQASNAPARTGAIRMP